MSESYVVELSFLIKKKTFVDFCYFFTMILTPTITTATGLLVFYLHLLNESYTLYYILLILLCLFIIFILFLLYTFVCLLCTFAWIS